MIREIVRILMGVLLVATAASAASADRPNILFIFSDDHAQHAISAYGSQVNTTPHIDRLAVANARFTHCCVTNSICTPSRATLLTGQYSHVNGVPVFNRFDGSRDNEEWALVGRKRSDCFNRISCTLTNTKVAMSNQGGNGLEPETAIATSTSRARITASLG